MNAIAFDDFMMHTDEELEDLVAPRRRNGDQKTGPVRLAGDADPEAEDFDREPEDTRDMLNLHLKRTNVTLDKNFERMERAIVKLTDTLEKQDERHAELLLKVADRNAQAQVDAAAKAAETRKYESRVNGVLVGALVVGVLALGGLNVSMKWQDAEMNAAGSR